MIRLYEEHKRMLIRWLMRLLWDSARAPRAWAGAGGGSAALPPRRGGARIDHSGAQREASERAGRCGRV